MRSEKIVFEGSQGAELAARLDRPATEPVAYALFAHCFTCSKDVFAASRVSKALTRHGIGVLRFDFTGLGHSDGEFENTTFTSNVTDIVRAASYLDAEHGPPKLLIGHSLGGAAVLMAAREVPTATAVATIGAPCSPEHVGHLFGASVEEIASEGVAEVTIAGRTFRIRKEFLDDILNQDMTSAVRDLGKALVAFHGPLDNVVGIDNAKRIYEAARHPKSFISLDDADHMLTDRRDATYVADVLAAWAGRYIAEDVASEVLPRGEVRVEESGEGGFANVVQAGKHVLRADEPEGIGDDTGPSPYDLLLAALGACTSMTLRMYADHKEVPLERVSVRLSHDKIHASDCEDCETREGKIDRIERVVSLEGELSDEQRERLLDIANRCPVHRTLRSEISILTSLDPDEG